LATISALTTYLNIEKKLAGSELLLKDSRTKNLPLSSHFQPTLIYLHFLSIASSHAFVCWTKELLAIKNI